MPKRLLLPLLGVMLGLVMVASNVTTTRADPRNFTLINASVFTIDQVYLAVSASDNDWGDDILGVDVLLPGESIDILFSRFDGEAGVCLYDLRVVFVDGVVVIRNNINLCTTSTITFSDV